MHVVVDRLPRHLTGRGEQWPDVDGKAEISESRGDHFLAAVVAVLADLGDQDAWRAALLLCEGGDTALHPLHHVGAAASSIRNLGMPASIALAMPPKASTSAIWAEALLARSALRRST